MGKIINKMKILAILVCFCRAERDFRVWKGNDFYASWTAGGLNRPAGSQIRSYESIFDDDPETIWHGKLTEDGGTVEPNFVAVNFIEPVHIKDLQIQLRNDQIYETQRYKDIRVYMDGVE